jgi:hypothetical protein
MHQSKVVWTWPDEQKRSSIQTQSGWLHQSHNQRTYLHLPLINEVLFENTVYRCVIAFLPTVIGNFACTAVMKQSQVEISMFFTNTYFVSFLDKRVAHTCTDDMRFRLTLRGTTKHCMNNDHMWINIGIICRENLIMSSYTIKMQFKSCSWSYTSSSSIRISATARFTSDLIASRKSFMPTSPTGGSDCNDWHQTTNLFITTEVQVSWFNSM